jgi:hypothetical protein
MPVTRCRVVMVAATAVAKRATPRKDAAMRCDAMRSRDGDDAGEDVLTGSLLSAGHG